MMPSNVATIMSSNGNWILIIKLCVLLYVCLGYQKLRFLNDFKFSIKNAM